MSPTGTKLSVLILLVLLIVAGGAPAEAAGPLDIGLRLNVVGGSGKPTNDILGFGLVARHRLNDRWRLGVALDHSPEFDIERAPEFVGLATPIAVDAIGTSTALSAWLERNTVRNASKYELYCGAGLGLGSVDVDPLVGLTSTGESFDIAIDAGTELAVVFNAGVRRRLGAGWGFEAQLRLDHHFADWTVIDRATGAKGAVGDYWLRGVSLIFSRRP